MIKATMNIKEAAEYVGVSVSTIRRWIKDYGFPALKLSIGGRVLFKKELIDEWLDEKMKYEPINHKPYQNLRVLKP